MRTKRSKLNNLNLDNSIAFSSHDLISQLVYILVNFFLVEEKVKATIFATTILYRLYSFLISSSIILYWNKVVIVVIRVLKDKISCVISCSVFNELKEKNLPIVCLLEMSSLFSLSGSQIVLASVQSFKDMHKFKAVWNECYYCSSEVIFTLFA